MSNNKCLHLRGPTLVCARRSQLLDHVSVSIRGMSHFSAQPWFPSRREETDASRAQTKDSWYHPAYQSRWLGEPKSLDELVVQQGMNRRPHHRRQKTRKPTDEQLAGRFTDAAIRFSETIVLSLIVPIKTFEGIVVRGNVADVHAPADFTPKVKIT